MHEDSPDRKIPIVMETCFSEGKLMKQFGTPLFLTETPPFQLTPYLWAIFSWPPSLSKFQIQTPTLILGGEETMTTHRLILPYEGEQGQKIFKSLNNYVKRLLPKNYTAQHTYIIRKLGSVFDIKTKQN